MKSAALIYEVVRQAGARHTVVQARSASGVRHEAPAMLAPGRDWAKVVTCLVDGEPIAAILPASLTINLDRLLALSGGSDIGLLTEETVEQRRLTGAPKTTPAGSPPDGPLVFVDVALVSECDVVITGGTIPDAIRIRWADFAKHIRPIVGKFAEPPLLWARCRLSPRE